MISPLLIGLASLSAGAQEPPIVEASGPSIGLHARQLIVADRWLDRWLRNGDLGRDRPRIGGQSYTLVVAPSDPLHGLSLFVEYGSIRAEDGYWNADAVSGKTDPTAGFWIQAEGVGYVGAGLQFRYAAPIVQSEAQTDVLLTASLELGAAGGVGKIKQWHHGNADSSPSTCGDDLTAPKRTSCPADERWDVPGFLPIAGLQWGVAVRIRDRLHILVEAGVHQLPNVGLGVSYRL